MAQKMEVSERALLQRINRRLAKADQKICRQRAVYDREGRGPLFQYRDLGQFYRINTSVNGVVAHDVDLESLGRELGALKPWEVLEER